MAQTRTPLLASALLVTAILLATWTLYEFRQQKQAIERGLQAQAEVLAYSLGPGLTAASNAAREIEEIIVWKLLDNARFLARLPSLDLDSEPLERIIESNGLDWVAFFDSAGSEILALGSEPHHETSHDAPDLSDLLFGPSDEVILDPVVEDGIEHLAVAVARPDGGAVLVRVEAHHAQTYVKSVGVGNLLQQLAGSAPVLYLAYREDPGGARAEASWDGGEVPKAPSPEAGALQWVRGREVYEAAVSLDSPAGSRASLRVGLDGAPLRRAAISAMRRSLLVGTVLAALGLLAAAFALVARSRSQEREQAERRLAAAEERRRRSERLAAAGTLTAGLAHEVRSPLNAIGMAAQRLQRKLPDGDSRRIAGSIGSEVVRLEGVLREFLELAGCCSNERCHTDVGLLCSDVVELLEPEARALGVELDLQPGTATAEIQAETVRRAIINLIRNALQASPRGSRVVVRIQSEGDFVEIVVEDRGPGIAPELRERVFEAFVTGKASGTGLGLALVRRTANEHNGAVTLENRAGGGAEARLRLRRE